ncbi:MAG: IS200/IS605 family transposase [Saprospiraceae bacterium]
MANTYKKVYLHIIFAVKNRNAILHQSWRPKLFSYMSGVLTRRGHYSLAVNGHVDHVHLLLDYSLEELIPDLVREIKKASSRYIIQENLSPYKFEWQSGYGVFSVGWKEKKIVQEYVLNQEQHHNSHSFQNEYYSLLNEYNIDFKDEYVFEFFYPQ